MFRSKVCSSQSHFFVVEILLRSGKVVIVVSSLCTRIYFGLCVHGAHGVHGCHGVLSKITERVLSYAIVKEGVYG